MVLALRYRKLDSGVEQTIIETRAKESIPILRARDYESAPYYLLSNSVECLRREACGGKAH